MNEEALIRWIRSRSPKGAAQTVGIGDDGAVVRTAGGKDWILTADMIVEGVDFETRTSREEDWGRKAVLCNASDIAAMGGVPRFCLVSAGFPKAFSLARAKRIQRGIEKACAGLGITIAGGDVSRADKVVISVAMTGEVERGQAVTRGGAKAGDVVFVTGRLGGSLASGRHLRFKPRVAEARYLVSRYSVHAMIDVSDGLSKDLRHLSEESGVGFRIFESAVPLHPEARSVKNAFLDGEDFELVFTLGKADAARLLKDAEARRRKFTFYPIGTAVSRQKGSFLIDRQSRLIPFPKAHDHHFS